MILDFLVAVARSSLHGVPERLQWPADPRTVDAAFRHGILMQLHDALPRIDGVPDDARTRLHELVREAARRTLTMTAALRNAVRALETEGIDTLAVKGPLLADILYGSPAARGAVADLDLVVRRRDFHRAVDVLRAAGYERREHFHDAHDHQWEEEANLFPPGNQPWRIELHSVLGAERGFASLDVDAVIARSRVRTFAGASLRTPAPEDNLLYLCVHGSQHMWGRLQWVVDVGALIGAQPPLDWSEVWRRAEAIQARRRVALGLHLAGSLIGAPVPRELTTDRALPRLERYVAAHMDTVTRGVDPSRLLVFRSTLAVQETARQQMSYLLAVLRPNSIDRASAPARLAWLARPARVMASIIRRRL